MDLLLDPMGSTPYGVAGQPDAAPGTISFTAFSVPASGYDSFVYTVIDDAGGITSTDFHVDII